MLPDLAKMSGPEKVLQLLVAANALARDLERELAQLEIGNGCGTQLKQIYDTGYLPTAAALADHLSAFEISDFASLRETLAADPHLASTQLRLVLELLYYAVMTLSE